VSNINRVTITGNLTRDPELRALPSGTEVCQLGVAVNGRRKNPQTGQWEEEPNFFDVTVFGAQGQNCAQYLSKGRPVAIDGRLRWSSWDDKNGGGKRSKVDIVAQTVQFLGGRDEGGAPGGGQANQGFAAGGDLPSADTSDFADPVGAPSGGGADDDIPF
jgi:single-strand DNA-binding protein